MHALYDELAGSGIGESSQPKLSSVVPCSASQFSIQGRGFTAVSVARADRHHPRPGIIKGTSVISIDIPSTLLDSTRLMRWFVPILDWKQLAQFVPMKLVVKAVDCVGAGDRNVLRLEVVPGIPALCAGAALLGAPLTHDFAATNNFDN